MNVGFYYHVDAVFDAPGVARVPALHGLWVEELARQAGRLTFYVHGDADSGIEDYALREPLVRCVDLGPRRRFPERLFLPSRSLRSFRPREDDLDVMLITGPSPLLPHLVQRSKGIPTALYIIGDYSDHKRDPKARTMPWWRDALIRRLFRLYTRWQRRVARGTAVFVNTPDLQHRFDGTPGAEVVILSSLTDAMVAPAPRSGDPGLGRDRPARLLFTGRIIPEKGLWEAAEALRILADRGWDVHLDIVGWEAPGDPVVAGLREHAHRHGVDDRLRFVGYVPAGPRLGAVYRQADAYVLPTHGEGFPRTIFEAMGAGLPVITTPVGGIPHWVRDGQEGILVEPKSAASLADGIERLLSDDGLRERIARCGWEFARDRTVEKGCQQLAGRLSDWTHAAGGQPSRRA